ncbi:MAG: hypothetical protein V1899_01050 [Planctomycetota bacterium]
MSESDAKTRISTARSILIIHRSSSSLILTWHPERNRLQLVWARFFVSSAQWVSVAMVTQVKHELVLGFVQA